MSQKAKTKESHILIFGTIFLFGAIFLFYKLTEAVVLNPANMIVHTELVYYDGKFSDKSKVADTYTALYVLNESGETIYATAFEYDKNWKEIKTAVQIGPYQNQFIKTEGPGVVYLQNASNTSSSTVRFSRWATFKSYALPSNFKF